MRYRNFEDMPVWQDARKMVDLVYSVCTEDRKLSKDFGMRDQLQRAALSVMNNIAEGFDAPSNRVFARYLTYAIQSCSEIISMSYVLTDVFKLNSDAEQIHVQAISLRKQVKGFRKYLQTTEK